MGELISAAPDSPEGDELDVLATLVDAYETKHHPVDPPDPIAAILFRMDQQHMSRRDLEPLVGSRARVSEVLTGRRPLTLAMIRRLTRGLGISADLLIAPARAAGTTSRASHRRVAKTGSVSSSASASRGKRKAAA